MYLLTTSQLTHSDYLWMLSIGLITMSAYIGRKHKILLVGAGEKINRFVTKRGASAPILFALCY